MASFSHIENGLAKLKEDQEYLFEKVARLNQSFDNYEGILDDVPRILDPNISKNPQHRSQSSHGDQRPQRPQNRGKPGMESLMRKMEDLEAQRQAQKAKPAPPRPTLKQQQMMEVQLARRAALDEATRVSEILIHDPLIQRGMNKKPNMNGSGRQHQHPLDTTYQDLIAQELLVLKKAQNMGPGPRLTRTTTAAAPRTVPGVIKKPPPSKARPAHTCTMSWGGKRNARAQMRCPGCSNKPAKKPKKPEPGFAHKITRVEVLPDAPLCDPRIPDDWNKPPPRFQPTLFNQQPKKPAQPQVQRGVKAAQPLNRGRGPVKGGVLQRANSGSQQRAAAHGARAEREREREVPDGMMDEWWPEQTEIQPQQPQRGGGGGNNRQQPQGRSAWQEEPVGRQYHDPRARDQRDMGEFEEEEEGEGEFWEGENEQEDEEQRWEEGGEERWAEDRRRPNEGRRRQQQQVEQHPSGEGEEEEEEEEQSRGGESEQGESEHEDGSQYSSSQESRRGRRKCSTCSATITDEDEERSGPSQTPPSENEERSPYDESERGESESEGEAEGGYQDRERSGANEHFPRFSMQQRPAHLDFQQNEPQQQRRERKVSRSPARGGGGDPSLASPHRVVQALNKVQPAQWRFQKSAKEKEQTRSHLPSLDPDFQGDDEDGFNEQPLVQISGQPRLPRSASDPNILTRPRATSRTKSDEKSKRRQKESQREASRERRKRKLKEKIAREKEQIKALQKFLDKCEAIERTMAVMQFMK